MTGPTVSVIHPPSGRVLEIHACSNADEAGHLAVQLVRTYPHAVITVLCDTPADWRTTP